MALKKLDFVEKVDVDLGNTTTLIFFKTNEHIDIHEISKAVTRAGFSVGYIKLNYKLSQPWKPEPGCFNDEDLTLQLVNQTRTPLLGDLKLQVIGDDFMSSQDFRQWAGKLPAPCATSKQLYYVALD